MAIKRELLLVMWGAVFFHGAVQAQWHTGMVHGGSEIWYRRLPVTITNTGDVAIDAGTPVVLTVGQGGFDIQGARAEELRLVDAAGKEYLFFLTRGGGSYEKRRGEIQAGDQLEFGIDALAPGASLQMYLYYANPTAYEPDEFWPRFQNGGFETADDWGWRPEGWTAQGVDDRHSARWLESGCRSGSRCVYHQIASGSERTWVQWQQAGIKVLPGRRYTITAWVKSEDLGAGDTAGWYIHTYDVQGEMRVNQVQGAPSTGVWQQVTLTFDSQPQDATLTIGTVLHASSGEAWYDDVTLSVTPQNASLAISVGAPERLELTPRLGSAAWSPPAGGNFIVRAEVRVFNLDALSGDSRRLVLVDLGPAVHTVRRYARTAPPYRVAVVDAESGEIIPSYWLGERLAFGFRPQPASVHRLFVYLTGESQSDVDPFASYAALVRDASLNLLINPDIEDDALPPPGWVMENLGSALVECALDRNGPIGPASLRLTVQPGAPAGWPGFRQVGVPCPSDGDFLFAAAVKSGSLSGPHTLYGHFLSPSVPGGFVSFSTEGAVIADSDWNIRSGVVHSPADCQGAEIHLTMDSARINGQVWYDGVFFGRLLPARYLGVVAAPAASAFSVWPENPLVKVFPETIPPPAGQSELRAACARGEGEVLQLVLRSPSQTSVTLSVSELTGPGGYRLPKVVPQLVEYVPLDLPTSYYFSDDPPWRRPVPRGSKLTDGWAGWWPDPLVPPPPGQEELNFTLPAEQTRAVWLLMEVPVDAPAGRYSGTVTIGHDQGEISLPLQLTVWNFALPERPSLQIIYELGSQNWSLSRGYNLADVLQQYRFLKKYRVSPGDIIPSPRFEYVAGEGVKMDATDFLAAARVAFDEVKMSAAFTPWIFYAFGWSWPIRDFLGFKSYTTEYENAFTSAYRQFIELLEANGWKPYFTYYISDEPHYYREQRVVDDLCYVARLAQSVDPSFPIYSSTWGHDSRLDGCVTHWGAAQYGLFPVDQMRQRQTAGDKFWFTTDGQQAIDTPYLATERLLPTYCFAYDVDGYEFWGLAWWTYNPWKKGWHSFISQSDESVNYYRVRYPNGDGYVVYPGEPVGREGFLPSIRLEAVREGAEDYEYYQILSHLIAATPGQDHASAMAALQKARQLVSIPNQGGLHSLSIMPDPEAIYRVRAEIAAEIEKLLPGQPDGGDGGEDAWGDAGPDAGAGDGVGDGEEAGVADGVGSGEDTVPDAGADGGDLSSVVAKGCGCSAASGAPAGLLFLLALVRLRERKTKRR